MFMRYKFVVSPATKHNRDACGFVTPDADGEWLNFYDVRHGMESLINDLRSIDNEQVKKLLERIGAQS